MKIFSCLILIFALGCDDGPRNGTILSKIYVGNVKSISAFSPYLSTVTTDQAIISVDDAASAIIGDSVFIVKRVGYYDCLFIRDFSYRISAQKSKAFDFLNITERVAQPSD